VFRAGIDYLLSRSVRALDGLDERLWSAANEFIEKIVKIMRADDFAAKLTAESQVFLDAIEGNVATTK
jgi:hypothetical protein